MLVPFGMDERPHPEWPCRINIDVTGRGDSESLDLAVNAGSAWTKWYEKWTRRIVSPDPGEFEIIDDYALSDGEGVCFNWITALPVDITGNKALIKGKKGVVEVVFPAECKVSLEQLPIANGEFLNKITAMRNGKSGKIDVKAYLKIC